MRAAALGVMMALGGCAALPGLGSSDGTAVSYLGDTYAVRRVAEEPRPSLEDSALIRLPDGGLAVPDGAALVASGPTLRVQGAAERQTASDVVALYCAGRGADTKPGWRGAPVRFDPVTAEHVFYFDC
jgi:hypothetical protein